MKYQIKSYLKFLKKSTNQHGVHSPFVYDFITKCLYTKTNSSKIEKLTKYRTDLLKNNSTILVQDFGKGSRVFKSNTRKISKIAKVAGISRKRSKLLIRIVAYFKPKSILEIGTSLGIGTASMRIGYPESSIKSLEGCKNTLYIAKVQFKKLNLNSTEFIQGDFKDTLPNALLNKGFDLIYFDGNHSNEPTISYFELCLNSIHNDSVFIFDDIHWSREMTEAWEYIRNHPKVSVSIDMYFWGIVFFRTEQPKEHFTIRV